jgi:outer membrane usher protein
MRPVRRGLPLAQALAAALAVALLPAAGRAQQEAGAAGDRGELLLLDLCVDRQCSGVAVVLVRDGVAWVDREALLAAGVDLAGTPEETIDGRRYVRADAINHGAQASIDRAALRLDILRRPESLPPQRASFRRERPPVAVAPGLTAFLNYAATASTDRDAHGLFLDGAVARGTLSLRSTGQWSPVDGWGRGLTRLDLDQPERLRRWSLGDQAVLSPDPLGGGALLGGIGVQRAFDLDPFLLTFPQPFLSGVLETPGTVEVYANGALLGRRTLGAGPFSLEDLGVAQGRNDLRLVFRDPFGGTRELSSAAYYGSTALLAAGLDEYALRVGLPRRGLLGDDYVDEPVLAAFWRRGLSDWLTLGLRVEGDAGFRNAGASAALRLPLGEVDAAYAASRSDQASAAAAALGYRYATRRYAFSAGGRRFGEGYRALGDGQALFPRPERELYASLGWTPPGRLALQLNWTDVRYRSLLADRSRLGLDGSWRLHPRAQLLFGAARERVGGIDDHSVRAGLVVSLDRLTANLGARRDDGGTGYNLGLNRGRRGETGLAWDLNLARAQDRSLGFGRAEYQGERVRYALDAQDVDGSRRAGLTVSGGLVAIGGGVHAIRPVEGGFALVRLPGLEGIEVRRENRAVGRTDADGELLVTGLLPYYPVRIEFETGDVPVTWRTGDPVRTIAVARNAGALVAFDAAPLRALSGTLLLGVADGSRRPAAGGLLELRCPAGTVGVPVGASGRFYLEDAPAGRCEARWSSGQETARCALELPAATGADGLGVRRLPPLLCPLVPGEGRP